MQTKFLITMSVTVGAMAGCTSGMEPVYQSRGKGGSITATISDATGSNVDVNPYQGVSEGGGESVAGEQLILNTMMALTNDLHEYISLTINEDSSYHYHWSPQVGAIPLGPMSPATVHFEEIFVSENGGIMRYWTAARGIMNVTALSKEKMSFTLDATMMADSSAASGSFSLHATAQDLVF